VAVIDSGVNAGHPHVGSLAGGVGLSEAGAKGDFVDHLGHGTAVVSAIREKAVEAEIYAVKVFDRKLVTSGNVLLRALDWSLDHKMDLVNLSLGTLNAEYASAFEERLARAKRLSIRVVAALEMRGESAYPGCLGDVIRVVEDASCPRDQYRCMQRGGRLVYAASPFPRGIPGLPPDRNLRGVSFAVANVTGLLAAETRACLHT
jgi:subtilisin family serine protease